MKLTESCLESEAFWRQWIWYLTFAIATFEIFKHWYICIWSCVCWNDECPTARKRTMKVSRLNSGDERIREVEREQWPIFVNEKDEGGLRKKINGNGSVIFYFMMVDVTDGWKRYKENSEKKTLREKKKLDKVIMTVKVY